MDGPLAGGIPGIPAGIVYLAVNYGRLPLTTSLAPAIRYAEEGFELYEGLHRQISSHLDILGSYPSSAEVFLQDSRVPPIGHIIKQSDLAETLRSIASYGISGFYQGKMAMKLVHGMQQFGGIWSLNDLEQYVVLERRPIEINYQNIKVVSASLPSAGNVLLP